MNTRNAILALAALAITSGMPASAQDLDNIFYNDNHFHVVTIHAEGPAGPDVIKMMDEGRVGRSAMMSVAFTVAHNPQVDGDFVPIYYNQTDGPVMYYNPINDIVIATKYLALPEKDRARLDPLMNAFNLKDALAGEYIKKMILAFPGVWAGFGEIHFKKEDFASKVEGGPVSLESPSIDKIFDVIGELGATALVHCDIDAPGNLALHSDPFAGWIFPDGKKRPLYRDKFMAFLKRHPDVTFAWAHFGGLSRGVLPYEDHWDVIEKMFNDPDFNHVMIDISWGPAIIDHVIGTPVKLNRTVELMKKYPDRFIYGSDQAQTSDWDKVKGNYEVWEPVFKQLPPEALEKITKTNYYRIWDKSIKNIRAWEAKQEPIR